MRFRFLFAAGSWLIFGKCALVNVTIDDTFGDPKTGAQIAYLPGGWNNGTNCSGCAAHPDVTQAYLATWHDGTWNQPTNNTVASEVQTASVSFNGSAVYIYCIIAHSFDSPDGNADMTFLIDDETVGHYVSPPTETQPSYSYNVNVYSNTSVSPGQHTVKIQNGLSGQIALVLLDYITYSYDDGISPPNTSSSNTSSNKSHSALIAGAIVGALGCLLLPGLAFFFIRWRRRRFLGDPRNGFVIDAFPAPMTSSEGWVAGPDSASRSITQILSQPSTSGPSREASPGISRVTRATPSQENLLPSQTRVSDGPYAVSGANSSSTGSSSSGRNGIEVGPTRDNSEWNLLLTPRQVQMKDKKLPQETVP